MYRGPGSGLKCEFIKSIVEMEIVNMVDDFYPITKHPQWETIE